MWQGQQQKRGRMSKFMLSVGILIAVMAACAPPQNVRGPRLIAEVAITATQPPLPLGVLPTMTPTPAPINSEVPGLLPMPTVNADVVLVTPTLPPSKTPTRTPTFTLTPTVTLTPTITTTATTTAFLLPTSVIVPVTSLVIAPANQICDSNWFFLQPRPASCPLNIPNASNGVYQTFANGTMVWVGSQDAIYVMYNDSGSPRWEVYRDTFNEGMEETSGSFSNPPPNGYQPRRGFGMLWRGNEAVRNRIGWANMKDELPYSVQVQTARDGSIYISAPNSSLFGLLPSGAGWNVYSTLPTTNSALFGTAVFVPIPTVLGQ
jgi:hypothetical protein